MDLIDIDCELVLDALHLDGKVKSGHGRRRRTNREVLPYALELAANPIVVLLLFPPALQFVNSFAQYRVRPNFLWIRFLRQGWA